MPPVLSLTIPPEAEAVPRLLDAVEAFADAAGLAPSVAHRLALVVEEVAANLAMHGGGAASFLAVSVRLEGGAVVAVLEDDGHPFDPLANPAPDTESGVEGREAGGLGLHLVRRVARSLDYSREGARNRLVAVLDSAG